MATSDDIVIDIDRAEIHTGPRIPTNVPALGLNTQSQAGKKPKNTGGRFPYIDQIVELNEQDKGFVLPAPRSQCTHERQIR